MQREPGEATVVALATEPIIAARGASRRSWIATACSHPAAAPLFVAVLTAIVFTGSLANEFVDWDDTTLFVKNQAYRGLGWAQVSWMFSNVMMGHYVPVTWLTLGFDYVLWGMRPVGYHLTNLLLHATGAALFCLVARRLLNVATQWPLKLQRLGAVVAALFFSVHPLRTESVAWVTERRDVLSGLFFFVTLLLHLESLRQRPTNASGLGRRYWVCQGLAWFAYLLAILSKSMVMTLPAILILLDVYPLGRISAEWRSWGRPPAWFVWREKIPYAALGALAAMLGYYAQDANGFFTSPTVVPWSARPSLVLFSLWFYLSKTVVPLHLTALHELPAEIDPLAARFFVPAGVVVAVTVVLLALRRRWPAGLAAWLSYAIMLAPVAGLTHSGFQLAHDRYSYLPCLAWALLVGAAVAGLVRAGRDHLLRPSLVKLAVAVVIAWFAGLGMLTWQAVQTWHDSDTLWANAADAEPECALCRYNVGARAFNSGLPSVARDEFRRLLEARPDRIKVNGQLGLAYVALGDVNQAIAAYHRVLARDPNDAETHNNLGVALQILRRPREAIAELEWALRLAPDNPTVRANIGILHAQIGEYPAAIVHLTRALELKPDLARARFELATVLIATGRADAARPHYDVLQRTAPTFAQTLGPAFLTTW